MKMGEKIRQARKNRGLSQEALAEKLGLSVQAVSKWECELSCPDITLLPQLADELGLSLDVLLREDLTEAASVSLPDDGTLRIVQCVGATIVSQEEWECAAKEEKNKKIPLFFDPESFADSDGKVTVNVEIWGSADIEGEVAGSVNAGDGVNCGNVGGSVSAGDGVNCGNVGGSVNAGDSVNCGNVGGSINAGDSVNCGNVGGSVNAGDDVKCGDVHGNVRCEGDVQCHDIVSGEVICGGDIIYEK